MDHHLNYKSYNIIRKANLILKHIDPKTKNGQKIIKLVQGIIMDSASLDGDLVDLESRMSFLQAIVDRYPSYHWDDDDYPDVDMDED